MPTTASIFEQLVQRLRREAHAARGVMRLEQEDRHAGHGIGDDAVVQHGHLGGVRQREGRSAGRP
jgi:hypothetical protein